MDEQTLTAEQRRAAAMLAQGKQVGDVAAELSVNPRTVTRWSQREDVRSLIRHHRESLVPETPTAEAVLTAALSAVKPNGEPDWQNRIAAAKALLGALVTSDGAREQAARVERVYVADDASEPLAAPPPAEGAAHLSAVSGEGAMGVGDLSLHDEAVCELDIHPPEQGVLVVKGGRLLAARDSDLTVPQPSAVVAFLDAPTDLPPGLAHNSATPRPLHPPGSRKE